MSAPPILLRPSARTPIRLENLAPAAPLLYLSGLIRQEAADLSAMIDTSATLGGVAASDLKVPSQLAVKSYVDGAVGGLIDLVGSIDCSANPNYPAAAKGDAYFVSVAGKIGGGAGEDLAVGDVIIASADNAGGTEAAVGASWFALEHNNTGGTGVSDGDKVDIVVSGGGASFTVKAKAITLAKMDDMATASLIYRKTAGAGPPEVQSLAQLKADLALAGSNTGDQTSIASMTGTKDQFNAACTDGDFTFGWTAIETLATTSGTEVVFDNIPATFSELMFVFEGVSHNNAAAQFFYVAVSSNNGSSYFANDTILNATPASTVTMSGIVTVLNYRGTRAVIRPELADNTGASTMRRSYAQVGQVVQLAAALDAIKFYFPSSSFDAGQIVLWGR